jgi:hypothetical protein
LILRPVDIPTYVEYGAADVGIVGKDVIDEERRFTSLSTSNLVVTAWWSPSQAMCRQRSLTDWSYIRIAADAHHRRYYNGKGCQWNYPSIRID